MIEVGNIEKKTVSELNNELFNSAKKIMEDATEKPGHLCHIGWSGVGEFVDWLEQNYTIIKK